MNGKKKSKRSGKNESFAAKDGKNFSSSLQKKVDELFITFFIIFCSKRNFLRRNLSAQLTANSCPNHLHYQQFT